MREHLARKRALSGRTGCGVCGIEDLEHLPKPPRRVVARAPRATPRDRRRVGRAGELATLERSDSRGACRRVVWPGWRDPRGPRGRWATQRARQADRRDAASTRRSGRRFLADHEPLFVRDGREGGGVRRGNLGVRVSADFARSGSRGASRDHIDSRSPAPIRRSPFRTSPSKSIAERRRERREDRQVVSDGEPDRRLLRADAGGRGRARRFYPTCVGTGRRR